MIALIKGWIGSAAGWIMPVVILLAIAVIGYQAYQIEELSGSLELEREYVAKYRSAAQNNYAVLTSAQRDFNASLNGCFADYAELSRRFDDYRETIAANERARVIPAQAGIQIKECEIGKNNPLIDALNNLNEGEQ